jgi:hypothetical protein
MRLKDSRKPGNFIDHTSTHKLTSRRGVRGDLWGGACLKLLLYHCETCVPGRSEWFPGLGPCSPPLNLIERLFPFIVFFLLIGQSKDAALIAIPHNGKADVMLSSSNGLSTGCDQQRTSNCQDQRCTFAGKPASAAFLSGIARFISRARKILLPEGRMHYEFSPLAPLTTCYVTIVKFNSLVLA